MNNKTVKNTFLFFNESFKRSAFITIKRKKNVFQKILEWKISDIIFSKNFEEK